MTLIQTLRRPRIGPFAVFDFVTAFSGAYFLAPRLGVSRKRALWAAIPAGVLVHQLLGIETPLNRMVFGPGGLAAKAAVGGLAYKALAMKRVAGGERSVIVDL